MDRFDERIRTDPRIMGGKPHIPGASMTVSEMVRLVHSGIPVDEVARLSGARVTAGQVELAIRYHGRMFTR